MPPMTADAPGHDTDADFLPVGALVAGKFRIVGPPRRREIDVAYAALHEGTGRRVELRALSSAAADATSTERVLRAARAAWAVPHASILGVLDSGIDDAGGPFVVYEYFASDHCAALVAREGPLPQGVAAALVYALLDALSGLHRRGVIHRCLRPEHVLVQRSVGELCIKLTGFEYSKAPPKLLTVPSLPRGYSRYLAPEGRRAPDEAGPGLDIYAVGVLLRFLLTGSDATLPTDSVELSPRAERTIARATAADSDERFASAEQFAAAVALLLPEGARRESVAPSDPLVSDLRYLQKLKLYESGVTTAPDGHGRFELHAVLLVIEALYARIGRSGWSRFVAELPEVEALLPQSAGRAALVAEGVPAHAAARLLSTADAMFGSSDLGLLVSLGEAAARRGLKRFCPSLPDAFTPASFVDCLPELWRAFARHGELALLECTVHGARVAVRAQRDPSLEMSAVFAGLLRGGLHQFAPTARVHFTASETLGDAADILEFSFGATAAP